MYSAAGRVNLGIAFVPHNLDSSDAFACCVTWRRQHLHMIPSRMKRVQRSHAGACVAISAQIEAALRACEGETSKLGQDYYAALAASSPAAAAATLKRPPSPSKGSAPAAAKSKPGTDDAAAAEVTQPS